MHPVSGLSTLLVTSPGATPAIITQAGQVEHYRLSSAMVVSISAIPGQREKVGRKRSAAIVAPATVLASGYSIRKADRTWRSATCMAPPAMVTRLGAIDGFRMSTGH